MKKQNILFIMCDQLRFDCINALGNNIIKTPNLDRLVKRGVSYQNAYSTCPVCVPARYTVMTGREPNITGCYINEPPKAMDNLAEKMSDRCGEYLAKYLSGQGYRTFGIGKFHTFPDCYEDLGFEVHRHTEELWETKEVKGKDAYANYIMTQHKAYTHIDQLHGERTNMYYVPQMSPLPKELTVESFVADISIEELQKEDARPYFGFISFIGPHPPCAPPAPYNLMYNPDVMRNPIKGQASTDAMDEQIEFMNYAVWAEDISNGLARNIISRYYGEISYIDDCIGRILDVVEAREDADDTLICFFSDHGDHMGDHGAWQKESFFEASTKVPFLLSAPHLLPQNIISYDLICLTDLFAIATKGAGCLERRDGFDILGGDKRDQVVGVYGGPGTPLFKIMLRKDQYKYIFMANGRREQLFDLSADPNELVNLVETHSRLRAELREWATSYCKKPGLYQALENNELRGYEFKVRDKKRVFQFEMSKNINNFEITNID